MLMQTKKVYIINQRFVASSLSRLHYY